MPILGGVGSIIIPTEVYNPKIRLTITADDGIEYTVVNTGPMVYPSSFEPLLHLRMNKNLTDDSRVVIDSSPEGNDAELRIIASLYYPFNGNADDESTNSNDGTITGATLTTDHLGNDNNAYSFSGVSGDKLDTSYSLDMSQAFTLSFWIKRTEDWSTSLAMSDKFNEYSTRVKLEQRFGTELRFRYTASGATVSAELDNLNEWYHLVWVHGADDGGSHDFKVYQNGVLKGNETFTGSKTDTVNFSMGRAGTAFQGFELDDVLLFQGTKLTAGDALRLYRMSSVHKLDKPLVTKTDSDGNSITGYELSTFPNNNPVGGFIVKNSGGIFDPGASVSSIFLKLYIPTTYENSSIFYRLYGNSAYPRLIAWSTGLWQLQYKDDTNTTRSITDIDLTAHAGKVVSLCFTLQSGEQIAYVNNINVASATSTWNYIDGGTTSFNLGDDTNLDDGAAEFIYSDMSVFAKVLSESERTRIYNGDPSVDYMINGSVTKPVRDSIGRFNFRIANPNGMFTDKFNGGEVVEIYFDYNDASNLFFRGKIDNPKHGLANGAGFYLDISGRDYPELVDKTAVASFISANAGTALKTVLADNYSDITFTYWENDAWTETPSTLTTTISAEYQNQKGIAILSDICQRANLDCFLEYDDAWYLRVFVEGTKTNVTESIAYGINLLALNDFGKDNLSVKNRIFVYGKSESDNILMLRTKNDLASQSNLWVKDEIITDGSISTNASCEEKAVTVLSQKSTVYDTGRLNTIGLYSVKPGENVFVSIPYININDTYRVQEITTNFNDGGVTSALSISEKVPKLVDVFKRHDATEDLVGAYDNLNGMTNSFVAWFDEAPSIMSLSGCVESEGKLLLETGQTTGTATLTSSHEADANIIECEFRRFENYNTNLDILEISNDNGTNWEAIDKNVGIHVFSSAGALLKFRITLNRDSASDPSPSYDSIAVLYK